MTYAPAQFALTDALLALRWDYESTKFLGRLPSVLFGLLAALLTYLACSPRTSRAPELANVFPTLLVLLAWQQIIYSAQMENYAAATCGGMAMIYLLGRLEHAPSRLATRFSAGLFVGGLTALQYQLAMFVPGFMIALGLSAFRRNRSWSATVRELMPVAIGSALIFAAVTLPYLHRLRGSQINWNVGPAGEFLFTIPPNASAGTIWDAAAFFATNGYLVIESMLMPVGFDSAWRAFLAPVAVALVAAGAAAFWIVREPATLPLRWFIGIGVVVWFVFVATGKLALGPTRHQMAFVPYFLVLAGAGGATLEAWLSRRVPAVGYRAGVALCLTWIAAFGLGYQAEAGARADPFSEDRLVRLAEQFNVTDVVQHGWTANPSLMPQLLSRAALWTTVSDAGGCEVLGLRYVEGSAPVENRGRHRIMFVSHRMPFPLRFMPCVSTIRGDAPAVAPVLIHSIAETSVTQIEWSRRTLSGTNGFFVEIFDF